MNETGSRGLWRYLWMSAVFGWFLYCGFVGCFASPNTRGLLCSEDTDCLNSYIKCLEGFCGGRPEVPDRPVQELGPAPEPMPDESRPEERAVLESSPEPSDCEIPKATCSGKCVDIQNDPKNCGGCGTNCGDFLKCLKGTCESQAYVACSDNPARCKDPFICVQINPVDSKRDYRCLKKCPMLDGCDESEFCTRISGTDLACFRKCDLEECKKSIGDNSLYCSSDAKVCISGTCGTSNKDCKPSGPSTTYGCVDYSQPGSSMAYRCATTCTTKSDCPIGEECRCAQGKTGCGDGKAGFCFLPCHEDSECQKSDVDARCLVVDNRKFCLFRP